jgi:hypothetical protein
MRLPIENRLHNNHPDYQIVRTITGARKILIGALESTGH